MNNLQQKFKKILSFNSLNEKDYRQKVEVKSVSKQQFEKQKKERKIKHAQQSQFLFLQLKHKRLIKKYNQNLKIIMNLIEENVMISKQLSIYSRIQNKINIIYFIKQKLRNFKSWLYKQDMDAETLKQKIRANK